MGFQAVKMKMGFGPDEDRFVVFGDGDEVVNITYAWRDEIPDDWEQLPNAPHRRIAGIGPANMGDPDLPAIQTEQSITVSGYGAMTVNNEPSSLPDWLPQRGSRLLCFFLGHHDRYTPFGLHKYEWDPVARELREAWVNTEVSSPNSVPYVSQGADLVYTCGTRNGQWTIEALDYEVYSPMAERVLESIARDEGRRSGVLGILVRHSRGRVAVGEVSFVCEIASAHRAEGLEALGSFIDRMKREAPIWKRPVPASSD